jgi:uncharacterized membrane-anchored protein YitT (DUF2179 family)
MEITKDSVDDILIRFVVAGQSKGAYSIKEAAYLYKVVTDIKNTEVKDKNYDAVIRAIVVANGKGTYSLEEAAIVEKIVEFLESEKLITTTKPTEPKVVKEI